MQDKTTNNELDDLLEDVFGDVDPHANTIEETQLLIAEMPDDKQLSVQFENESESHLMTVAKLREYMLVWYGLEDCERRGRPIISEPQAL